MRLNILLIPFLLLGIINFHTSAQTIQKKYIRYAEKFENSTSIFQNQGIPLKEKRVSNKGGNIILSYDESLPDSIKTSLIAAKKLWEAKLPTAKQPIFISILFEDLGENMPMAAEVAYCESSNLMGCPCALASQLSDLPYGSLDSPDGYIIFNSNINWNCIFSTYYTSEYNLPTMTLRGIARCLGFGSSIFEDSTDNFVFFFGWPTYFDKLLYYENNSLFSLNEGSLEMANFVKSNKIYANTKFQKHKIYAPTQFIQDLSLCYFEDLNSLMSHSLGQGCIDLSIDDKTSDVLNAIGWDLPSSGLSIKCDDIYENGIGSSYSSHTFSLSKENENISDYKWKFLLKDKLGNYIPISNGTTEHFTIEMVNSPQNYFININGDLEGRIECTYTMNNNQYNATPFSLSLELKPFINSIDNVSINNSGPYEFYLLFNVNYAGADYVSVEIEEEYNTTLRNYRIDEPYIAHVKTGNITNLYYSWITIIVSNKYGTTYETLEYAPIFRSNLKNNAEHLNPEISLNPHYNNVPYIQLQTLDGRIIFEGSQSEYINTLFNPGIYLKKEITNNGFTKTSKILIK